ncbi:MAG: glycosyltransferase family 39 protein [Anaerolineales bacterium]
MNEKRPPIDKMRTCAMTERAKNLSFVLLGLTMLLAATWALGYAIEPGIGLTSDSYYYVSGADTLQAGLGFGRVAGNGEFKPTTHFPPLYSSVLLLARTAGGERIAAAAVVQQLCLLGMLALGSLLVYRLTGLRIMVLLFILLAGFSPAMLAVFSWLLSEGMFLLLILAALAAISQYQRSQTTVWLIAAGILTGLSYLTRYVGITLAAAIALAIFMTASSQRWRSTAIYLASSALLPLIWMVRNVLVAGATTNRSLGWHPITLEKLHSGVLVMANWLLPGQIPGIIRVGGLWVLAGILLLGSLIVWRRSRKAGLVEVSLLVFLVVYPVFLVASISILDAATPLDDRILSPLYPLAVIVGLVLLVRAWKTYDWPAWSRTVIVIGVALFCSLVLVRGFRQIKDMHLDGQGFANAHWQESALIAWLNDQPDGTTLYSNELDAIYLLTGHLVYQIPIKWDPVRQQPRDDFEEQLQSMRSRLESKDGYLVLVETLGSQQAFFPSEDELSQGLESILVTPLGTVYSFP